MNGRQTWDEVELVVDAPQSDPAEGPLWDPSRQVVWWVDIVHGSVHRFDPSTKADKSFAVGEPVGAVAHRRDGTLLAHVESGLIFFDPDSGELEPFVAIEAENEATRANDGKAGPDGCYWGGTMGWDVSVRGQGALYRVTPDATVQTVITNVSISNGLDWQSSDRLYFIDSFAHGVDVIDVDLDTGALRQRTRLIDIPESVGLPDGMTLDADGFLWVAVHGAGAVHRYTPEGQLVGEVIVRDAPLVTSCAFGGPGLDDLYITAAHRGLYRCPVGIAGREPFVFSG